MLSAEVWGNLVETFDVPKMFIDSQWFQCSKEKCQIVYKVPQPWFSDSTLSWFFTEWPRTSTGRPRHVAWTCETGEQRWFGTQHEHTNWCDFGEDLDLRIFFNLKKLILHQWEIGPKTIHCAMFHNIVDGCRSFSCVINDTTNYGRETFPSGRLDLEFYWTFMPFT